MNDLKVVLIHGNGGSTSSDHWFPELTAALKDLGVTVIAKTFPDNEVAHESVWFPFLKNEIKADENTIIVGHSSGAVAAMRYAETNKIFGSVLVGACYTDLNDPIEKEAGYYNRPWDWEKIKANQNWIMQFASSDDPYISVDEPRFIREKLNSEYNEYSDKGHFMFPHFPELIEKLTLKLKS